MSTVHQLPDGLTMLTKGAVDVMLGRTRLSPEEKAEIERMNEELSQQGLRVLAFGKRMLTAPRHRPWRMRTTSSSWASSP